jgi:hypothetical protein
MLDVRAPTGDADVLKCLSWQEALEPLDGPSDWDSAAEERNLGCGHSGSDE